MAGRRALASAVTAASRVQAAAGRAAAGGAAAARGTTTSAAPAARAATPAAAAAAASAALPELAHAPVDAFPPPRPIITAIKTDAFGAVSPAEEGGAAGGAASAPALFRNEDGARVDDGRYGRFLASITSDAGIPADRIFQDPLRTFAYATDASFYRLVPKAVVKVRYRRERAGGG